MTHSTRREVSPSFVFIVLSLLLTFILLGHIAWLSADTDIGGYNELAYLDQMVKYGQHLQTEPATRWFGYLDLTNDPPLAFFFAHLVSLFAGKSIFGFRLASAIFHLIWILAAYGIGRRLDRPMTGLVAAFLVAFSPAANLNARHFAVYVPQAAFTALAVYALVRTELARSLSGALFTGLMVALAFLTERGMPVIFLAGPLLYAFLFRLWKVDRQQKGRVFGHFFAMAAVILLVAGPYLFGYVQSSLDHIAEQSSQPLFPGRTWSFYLTHLRGFLFPPVIFPLLLAAIGIGAYRRDHRLMLPFAWLAVSLVVFSAIATRDLVYVVSLATPLAVGAGLGVSYLPRKWWRFPIFFIVLLFMLINWYKVGNPDAPPLRGMEQIRFFGLLGQPDIPHVAPRAGIDSERLLAAVAEVHAGQNDVWVATGARVAPEEPVERKELGEKILLLFRLHGVEGRFFLALNNMFPGRIEPVGFDQHLVLVPAAAVSYGSWASRLARPAFDSEEHWTYEKNVIDAWQYLQLRRIRVMGLAGHRLFLYRATLPPVPEAVAESPPTEAAIPP